jgi:hypothetical protein
VSAELDDQREYDQLRAFAWRMGFFAQIHRNFDPLRQRPGRENACWYLQRSHKFGGRLEHEQSILKYSTPEELYAWLSESRLKSEFFTADQSHLCKLAKAAIFRGAP